MAMTAAPCLICLTLPSDQSTLDPDDLMLSGPGIAVHDSVLGGITIEGIGVEDDLDDDGDGLLDTDPAETNDNATASVSVYGSAPALLIQATPASNLVLGATASGYGLHVRGSISATGLFDGIGATALRIEGDSGGGLGTTDSWANLAF